MGREQGSGADRPVGPDPLNSWRSDPELAQELRREPTIRNMMEASVAAYQRACERAEDEADARLIEARMAEDTGERIPLSQLLIDAFVTPKAIEAAAHVLGEAFESNDSKLMWSVAVEALRAAMERP